MSMPNLLRTIQHFGETLRFTIVKKTVQDGDLIETSKVKVPLYFDGTLQPVPPQKLLVKPEGERKWKWWVMYSDLKLDVDWIIEDSSQISYRVMSITDWHRAGYYQYELTEGPTS